ncbi:MAG TPA: acyltransferase domain-containing protein, partial [Gammaproteobacteria bacterium]|nr:acyltransferase domain-containing protein [Gammaproteobacteria bacterium]
LSPTGNAKPFDENGDGTILGEGLGVVVLKRLDDAERDGDRVYAVLRSIGSSSDGKGEAIYAPSSEGQKKALRRAYEAADVTPDTIELLEAHGPGTARGDAVEARALNEVYGEAGREGRWCAIGSVKSQIGHTKAAAGVAGLIKTALALHYKVQPPTIKVTQPLDEFKASPLFVNALPRPWVASADHPRRAALSAFGFGGSNFHCVLEETDSEKREADWDGQVQLFTCSAGDAEGIRRAVSGLSDITSWDALRAAAFASRRSFDHRAGRRLAFVVERDRTEVPKLVATVGKMLDRTPDEPWSTPDGIFYGVGEANGKLAMIFPGQGSQYVGMLRDLSCLFPQMLDALRDANEAFAEGESRRLTDLIYPPPAFDDETRQRQEADLRAIEVAQPAIGAVSVGAFSVLRDLGVMPEAVAGHSYGELMALCAAGSYDADALYSLSRLRAQLMASGGGDKGAMLAVRAPLHDVEQLVAEERLDVVVANRNAPTQAVLSGAALEIERALEACVRRKIQSKKIPVAAAFHSPLVAHAREPFLAALREIDFSAAAIPVFANTSAREYPTSIDEARELLAAQLASPVDFVSEILAMHDNGVRTFIEVGP